MYSRWFVFMMILRIMMICNQCQSPNVQFVLRIRTSLQQLASSKMHGQKPCVFEKSNTGLSGLAVTTVALLATPTLCKDTQRPHRVGASSRWQESICFLPKISEAELSKMVMTETLLNACSIVCRRYVDIAAVVHFNLLQQLSAGIPNDDALQFCV